MVTFGDYSDQINYFKVRCDGGDWLYFVVDSQESLELFLSDSGKEACSSGKYGCDPKTIETVTEYEASNAPFYKGFVNDKSSIPDTYTICDSKVKLFVLGSVSDFAYFKILKKEPDGSLVDYFFVAKSKVSLDTWLASLREKNTSLDSSIGGLCGYKAKIVNIVDKVDVEDTENYSWFKKKGYNLDFGIDHINTFVLGKKIN